MSSRTKKLPPSKPVLPAAQEWDFENVVTEDEAPVDGLYSQKQMPLLSEPLDGAWAGPGNDRPFVVMDNVGLFYDPSKPPLVPDMMLSLDVSAPASPFPKKNRSYFVSVYRKPPDVVVEIVSNSKGKEDTVKKRTYAKIGVLYYVIWDPDEYLGIGPLSVFKLHGKSYKKFNDLWFPELNLGLKIWHAEFRGFEEDWLRWCDREGNLIPTIDEEKRRADRETRRADREAQRAADAIRQAEELAARVRELESRTKE